jgi:hypothetical protein
MCHYFCSSFLDILKRLIKINISYISCSSLPIIISKNGWSILSYHWALCIDCDIVVSWNLRINLHSHYWILKLFNTIVLPISYNLRSVCIPSVLCSCSWNVWLNHTLWEIVVSLIIGYWLLSFLGFLVYQFNYWGGLALSQLLHPCFLGNI